MIKESVHQNFWIPSVFFSRCEHGIIEKCTPTSNTKCKGYYFFLWLHSPFSQTHCKIWRKGNPFWLFEYFVFIFFLIILRSMYFHISCTMFLSTGSRSHANSLWALLILLIPIVLIIYKGKLLLHSNGGLKWLGKSLFTRIPVCLLLVRKLLPGSNSSIVKFLLLNAPQELIRIDDIILQLLFLSNHSGALIGYSHPPHEQGYFHLHSSQVGQELEVVLDSTLRSSPA